MDREVHNAAEIPHRSTGPRVCEPAAPVRVAIPRASVIVNADDWGGNAVATDRILDCILHGSVSSTSAMVFMEDSERAARLALEHHVDAGLHLNLTQAFTANHVSARLVEAQGKLVKFLRGSRYAGMMFHPLLAGSFEYVVKAQLEEFARLYGAPPQRIDGHHHAHLCANVQWQKLLPGGTTVRRNFTFAPGEKSWLNRLYRRMQDRRLARRHRIADYLFNVQPPEPDRLRRMTELAQAADVEIEVHPEREAEYQWLMEDGLRELGGNVRRGYTLHAHDFAAVAERVSRAANNDALPGLAATPHICVCICTYKRPQPLKRLLEDLGRQNTGGEFTFSIVVADNDEARSGEAAVEEMRPRLSVAVTYCEEPERGIARARNKVIENAWGDYIALIDDDEFPGKDWLLNLLKTCREYGVDGVLGPVRRYLNDDAPAWLRRSSLYDRAVNPTGMRVAWRTARTGNVLARREVFAGDEPPFRVEFKAGEDHDFFRRRMEAGRSFVWSADAVVYEELPPERWKRMYFVRKSLMHGAYAAMQPDCGAKSILKSLIAVPLYTLGLPLALIGGQHRFMTLLVKLCDHAGKLLFLMRIRPIRDEYVSD